MNAGAFIAKRAGCFTCLLYHDVDLFVESYPRGFFSCPQRGTVKHLTSKVDSLAYRSSLPGFFLLRYLFSFRLPYEELVGGAFVVHIDDFTGVLNGMSNSFWAWGGEDDEFGKSRSSFDAFTLRAAGRRVQHTGMIIDRPDAYYTMLHHLKRRASQRANHV